MKTLTFAFLSLLLFSCEEKLPKPTQEGSNTFGCKVDGKTWIPNGGSGFMPAKPINGGFFRIDPNNPSKIGVYITTYNKEGEMLQIFLTQSVVGEYNINQNTQIYPNNIYAKNHAYFLDKNKINYVTSSINTGTVEIIKSDTLTGIISGNFQFNLGSSNNLEVSITKGRFDINTKTVNK